MGVWAEEGDLGAGSGRHPGFSSRAGSHASGDRARWASADVSARCHALPRDRARRHCALCGRGCRRRWGSLGKAVRFGAWTCGLPGLCSFLKGVTARVVNAASVLNPSIGDTKRPLRQQTNFTPFLQARTAWASACTWRACRGPARRRRCRKSCGSCARAWTKVTCRPSASWRSTRCACPRRSMPTSSCTG